MDQSPQHTSAMSASQSEPTKSRAERSGAMPPTLADRPAFVHRPVGPSAAVRIAQTPEWAGVSERTVAQTMLTTVRRTAAALRVLHEMGLDARVAELLSVIDYAVGPRRVLPLIEALKLAQQADAEEELAETQLRFEVEMGCLTRATLEGYLRTSALESYRAEQLRQTVRAELERMGGR